MGYMACFLYGIGVVLYWVVFVAELYFGFPIKYLAITATGGVMVTIALVWLVYDTLLRKYVNRRW